MPAVTIIRRVQLALLLWTALAAEVMAAEAGNIFGIKLPQSIEEMFEVAYDDAEARVTFKKGYSSFFFQNIEHYEDPRLGYRLHYSSVLGINISLYVYTLGLTNIPDGTDSKAITAELANAGQEIASSRQYTRVEQHLDAARLSPHFAQAFYTLNTNDGRGWNSYTLLRGQNGFFIKMRISGPDRPMEIRIAQFLEFLEKDLGVDSESYGNASNDE